MGTMGGFYGTFGSGDSDEQQPRRLKPLNPLPDPVLDECCGNAAEDGYTRHARQIRGDEMGEIVPEDVANQVEKITGNAPGTRVRRVY